MPLLDIAGQRAGETRTPELARRRRGSGADGRSRHVRAAARAEIEDGGATAAHLPVLADELLELLDPQPGQTAIDCTFGDGGHARMVAERLGSDGTLIAIDRDPLAEQRFAMLAAEASCSVRFIRSGYAEALQQLLDEGVRADMAY